MKRGSQRAARTVVEWEWCDRKGGGRVEVILRVWQFLWVGLAGGVFLFFCQATQLNATQRNATQRKITGTTSWCRSRK